MQDSAVQTCPHGLRPGTTVCLHCRQEARVAARQRRNRLIVRAGLVTLGAAAVVTLIVGGIMAVAPTGTASDAADDDDAPPAAVVVATGTSVPADSSPRPTLRPAIGEGRRELSEGMHAVREGPQVTVYFDTELLRTRFDWKFEGIVRSTLPTIFGEQTRQAMDTIATGSLVRGGALLTELPERGFTLPVDGHTLRIWPVTRPGRDGPLVIAYRVRAE